MKSKSYRYCVVGTLVVCSSLHAELKMLDDTALSSIEGQSGISLDAGLQVSIGEIAYFDDGNALQFQGIQIGSQADITQQTQMNFDFDIQSDASLRIAYDIAPTRVFVSDIRLDDDPVSSFGGVGLDFALQGVTVLKTDGLTDPSKGGIVFDTDYALTNGGLIYRTNGNEIYIDDFSMNVSAHDVVWEPHSSGNGISYRVPLSEGDFSIGAIRFSDNPNNFGVSNDVDSGLELPSFGAFSGDFSLTSEAQIQGGGRFGTTGIRIDSQNTINSMNLVYTDDTNKLSLLDITGAYNVNDMRLDVATDRFGDKALAVTFGSVDGNLSVGRILAGSAEKSFGGFDVDFELADQTIDGMLYSNQLYVKGGGNANSGPQGISVDAMWSLSNAEVSYTEDGNTVQLSGVTSYGQGGVTVDVTRDGTLGGEEFFDGLRLGFEDLQGSYKIDGLKVGNAQQSIENAELQGGTELLLALGVYPAFDFKVDGHITLGAGGASGDGITINSDMVISDSAAAVIVDENSKGLWLTDLNYDVHLRDMTIDMVDEGIQLVQGEAWSTMDIGNLRVGDKDSVGSFGRFVIQSYEVGSTAVISPGGAGEVCVGGRGATSAACVASGGEWEDRGEEGITVSLKQIFAEAVDDVKRNRFIWETNRTGGVGTPGSQVIFDNITTNDGVDGQNTYGFRNDISIDVHQTTVLKKSDGADANGVIGSKGDYKIMDGSAPGGYRYVSAPTAADLDNRPLGFAVQAHTHFKELSIDNVAFKHQNGDAQVGIHEVKLQNFSISSSLTATPLADPVN
ncbi:hypothetical protein OLMES_0665 [Oleiphilus messinensis]|uniref:DUF6160 domain-containing protein n=1 Tax=Oleiphilus messinensis TaxID=141451 RepID=A0A1Y0I2R1_9GAMM|nr:DUF6160 family protein [Oleiphilus messinensis]ARU54762.1 hypothetical protein OLMES_0665 [Oleiphilus messinensis]